MLANKVSPASLLSSEPSVVSENVCGTEDSLCNSQVSLFTCGSDPPSSIELFPDTHSQSVSQGDKFHQLPTTQVQSRMKATVDFRQLKVQPQISLRRTFFAKYLKNSKLAGLQKIVHRPEESQASRSSQENTYEAWKSSQKFTSDIQNAVKEGMKKAKDEIKSELEELRAAIVEHKSGVARTEQLSTQLLNSVTELRNCVEQCYQEKQNSNSIVLRLESQNAALSTKLDSLFQDLSERIRNLETVISSSVSRNSSTLPTTTTAQSQREPVRVKKKEASSANPLITDDRTVPSLKDLSSAHQDDSLTEPRLYSPKSAQINSAANNTQNYFSTPCDIDLTKHSPSVYTQMIANIVELSQKENTTHVKTGPHIQRRKGRKTQKSRQSPKVVRPLPAATRRSQRVKRTIKHQHNENDSSDDGEYSFQPKRRAFQPKKEETTSPKAVDTPGAGMDSFFFSQTPVAPSNMTASSGPATQQTIPEKQSSTANESSFFHRSAEAARRRVEVFAGLSDPTSTLLEISNVIKNQQEGYNYSAVTNHFSPNY